MPAPQTDSMTGALKTQFLLYSSLRKREDCGILQPGSLISQQQAGKRVGIQMCGHLYPLHIIHLPMVEMHVPDCTLATGLRTMLYKGPRSVSGGAVGLWQALWSEK